MNETQLSIECVTASSVNMFKNKVDTYFRRADYTKINNVGMWISQWLHCPLAIWAFALDCNLAKKLFNQRLLLKRSWYGVID